MNNEILIQATDNTGAFYVYTVGERRAPVVLVIQEIFGITEGLQAQCQQFADMGYHVVCPDSFWRQEPRVSLRDNVEVGQQRAFSLFAGFNAQKGIEDIAATIAYFNAPTAVVGYCLGGMLSYMTACQLPVVAAVSYYGVGLHTITAKPLVPTLLHFASDDEFVSAQSRQEVLSELTSLSYVSHAVYPNTHHAFARINGVHYNEVMATRANAYTKEFLQQHLPR